MRLRVWAALLACGLIAACAETRTSPPRMLAATRAPLPPPEPPSVRSPAAGVPPISFSDLPGWVQEDHAAALTAYAAGCGVARAPVVVRACRRARDTAPASEASARAFFEQNFRLEPSPQPGVLTAYFTPVYPARGRPEGEFRVPVRPRPIDLPATPPPDGSYPDRTAIEARPAVDALAWMRAEDLFFLQIQGSGVLAFPGGARARAVFDGVNGARFVAVAAPMRRLGLLGPDQTSGDGIRGWLAAHRGPQADAVIRLNPRYVFFRLVADDGRTPAGAAGLPLPPGRAVAIDPNTHAMGDLLWLDADAPILAGAFPAYRRLVTALDIGGAIKGSARADLYVGRGDAAGIEAGRVRHVLRLYRLTPIGEPGG